jgi:hypothetical protein
MSICVLTSTIKILFQIINIRNFNCFSFKVLSIYIDTYKIIYTHAFVRSESSNMHTIMLHLLVQEYIKI